MRSEIPKSLKTAVIGAGVGGIVAARELQREGHRVIVYEKGGQLGGTWVYEPRVEADELGEDPSRQIVHSSAYRSLRTNLPRHVMGFSDYPFRVTANGDSRNFPGHQEVLCFLNDFARDFGLIELIRFNAEVIRAERRLNSGIGDWVVESRTGGLTSLDFFDAVVVCNGHYTQPRLADIEGIEKWPNKQVHSHNYRTPEPYCNQVVVMIGAGPSSFDIWRDIAPFAKEVHLSSRSPSVKISKLDTHQNVWQHSKIDRVYEDGTVAFEDGSSVQADVIFHCTGYKYHFPFLQTNGMVTVEDNRVGPLYRHVFPPQLAPYLSFIGIPSGTIISHAMELQSKWVASVLSGKAALPPEKEMLADVEAHYQRMEEQGIPKHHTHQISPYIYTQEKMLFEYLNWLAAQARAPPVEERITKMYKHVFEIAPQMPGFRDEWDIDSWISQAI